MRKAARTAGIDNEEYVNRKMKEYEDEFPRFLEENFSPQAAATAILLNL